MDNLQTAFVIFILGCLTGMSGGAIGTWFLIKNCANDTQRHFMLKASTAMWILFFIMFFVIALTIRGIIPQWYRWIIMGVYFVGLWPAVMLVNRKHDELGSS
jgi:hypothetical protein